MCCHAQLVLMACCYCVLEGRKGTSAADNVQKINPIFMFMINSCRRFIRGLRVSRKHFLDNVKNSSKKKKCIHIAAVVVLLHYTVVFLLFCALHLTLFVFISMHHFSIGSLQLILLVLYIIFNLKENHF